MYSIKKITNVQKIGPVRSSVSTRSLYVLDSTERGSYIDFKIMLFFFSRKTFWDSKSASELLYRAYSFEWKLYTNYTAGE